MKKPFPFKLLQQLLLVLLLALLFSGLLSIAFLDAERFYLAWFAFIPLLFAIDELSLIKTYFLGVFAGLTLYMSGTYWIADFIDIAKDSNQNSNLWLAFAYWFYCSQQIALLVLLLNWLRKNTGIHDFILFPLVVAAITSAYPMLFSMRLGESQIQFPSAMQATEFFGVHSLDALIALVNIMLFRLLILCFSSVKKSKNEFKLPWLLSISVILVWFTYGVYSYASWDKEITRWETLKIGIIQPNQKPKVGKINPDAGYSKAYPSELEMTERLASLGAEITIWPEGQPKEYLDKHRIKSAYQNSIKKLDTSLIFQDIQNSLDPTNGEVITRYNSAIMLDEQGVQRGLYNKMKRIPFGEYIPLLSEGSYLKSWMEDFLGKFLNKYSVGEGYKLFKHDKINIIPLICYETTFPEFVASSVGATAFQADNSNGTMLVGLSNDGWFGSTHQPYQHIMASVLRAVENRLPLVHVANNGPSIVVTPHGKVIFTSDFQQAGGYLTEVPHSEKAQGSFYSQYPKLFIGFLYGILILISIYSLLKRLFDNIRFSQ